MRDYSCNADTCFGITDSRKTFIKSTGRILKMQSVAGMHKKLRTSKASKNAARQWIITPANDCCEQLAKSLKISPIVAQVLLNRGINDIHTASSFLRPRLAELIPPEKMPGATEAAKIITQAIKDKKKITVYGDYDVDGITGISILWHLMQILGGNVDFYIPHRVDEGYGLNAEAVEFLAKEGTELMITVDCGITAVQSAELAQKLGLDLIITDHHRPDEQLPIAKAIVHPAMDTSYQNQDSSGAMVAFKLAWVLAGEFSAGDRLGSDLREFMLNATSLAAMGTIADVMDLKGENRILTSFGLRTLAECKLSGVKALIETAGLTGSGLDSYDIGFRLAPMLNAAGRMGHARLAVELLTSDNDMRSMKIAEYLKQQNEQRRRYERKIFKEACEIIVRQHLNHPDNKTIVLSSPDWHIGVIGIVASRIIDKYHRPTILFNTSELIAQGSGRSIEGFDILSAIKACSKHLKNFGGHAMAAGVRLPAENIEQFASDFESFAKDNLIEQDLVAKISIDAVAPLEHFSHETVKQLQLLGPFGQGNPKPLFATKGVRLAAQPRRVGARSDHLQLAVTDNTNSIRCIGFGMGKLEKKLLEKDCFHVAYEPDINHFNGTTSVQLVLSDIQFD
ncbi:MAG: single-stranded-DNA-specific exonuclease RecJ [Sedimentisphaerales bacterium]|nr:single-stranded-DNA-specific exonuclease RecJ [Sedimentisphaerales bacterium]